MVVFNKAVAWRLSPDPKAARALLAGIISRDGQNTVS